MQLTLPETLKQPGIYLITNMVNGKKYVGQSVNIYKRWSSHRTKPKGIMRHAFHRYGIENFAFDVIEFCAVEQLNDLEALYTQYANSLVPNGYNIRIDPCSNRGIKRSPPSEEARANMSRGQRGRKPCSDETRAKISRANKGRILSDERKAQIASSLTGRKGHKHTDEAKAKMSRAAKGRKCSPPSEETRAKISRAGKGRKCSEETRAKMSLAQKGQKRGPMSDEHKAAISRALSQSRRRAQRPAA